MSTITTELQVINNEGVWVKLDLDKSTTFTFNLQQDDLTNPTAIKNSYSQQINLPKTQLNNDYFGQMWRIDNVVGKFNPLFRTDFRLYVNSTLYQSGYMKLEEIDTQYKIRLFGGLGDYFNLLSEMKLTAPSTDQRGELIPGLDFGNKFNHKITADFISKCWNGQDYLNTSGEKMNDYFGYAMTYQGQYDKFDNGSVLEPGNVVDEVTWTDVTLQTNNEFTNVELKEHSRVAGTASAPIFGEYRANYQKPMIKVSTIFNKIVEQQRENNGWETVLGTDYFNEYNPYWNNLWMILPQYEVPDSSVPFETLAKDQTSPAFTSGHGQPAPAIWKTWDVDIDEELLPTGGVSIGVDIPFNIQALKYTGIKPSPPNDGSYIFPNGVYNKSGNLNITCFLVADGKTYQLIYKELNTNSLIINNTTVLPTTINDNSSFYYQATNGSNTFTFTSVNMLGADGQPIPDGKIAVNDPSTIRVYFRLDGNIWWFTGSVYYFDNHKRFDIKLTTTQSQIRFYDPGKAIARSGSEISYDDIVKSSESCLDFMTSYTKLFDLQYLTDTTNKTVTITSRNKRFSQKEKIDWTQKLDYSKANSITPIPFDYRYGVFKWKEQGTKYEEQYLNKTAQEYGSMRIDTLYEFGDEEKDFLENNIFGNTIIATDYSRYYTGRSENTFKDNKILPFFEDTDGGKVDNNFNLVYWEGFQDVPEPSAFYVTDDMTIMASNGYMWNGVGDTSYTKTIKRYPKLTKVLKGNSLNFGAPSIVYNKDEVENNPNGTIYDIFWRAFIRDKFNENSKIHTAYFKLNIGDLDNIFKKFIVINNTLWVVHKISEYNPLSPDTTKVELLSVQDINNYVSQTYTNGRLTIKDSQGVVLYNNEPQISSITYQVTGLSDVSNFTFDSSIDWSITNPYADVIVSPTSGSAGITTVGIDLPFNESGATIPWFFTITWGNQTILLQINQLTTSNGWNGLGSIEVSTDGMNKTLNYNLIGNNWTTSGDLVVTPSSSPESAPVVVNIPRNETGAMRILKSIQTLQDGTQNTLTVNQASLSVPGWPNGMIDYKVNVSATSTSLGVPFVHNGRSPIYWSTDALFVYTVNLSYSTYEVITNFPENRTYFDKVWTTTIIMEGISYYLIIIQAGIAEPKLIITPPVKEFLSIGGSSTFTVESDRNWSISDIPTGLLLSPQSGGAGITIVTTQVSSTIVNRELVAIIRTIDESKTSTFTATQYVDTLYFRISPTSVTTLSPAATTIPFTIQSNTSWFISGYSSWITIGTTQGVGNYSGNINIAENTTTNQRVNNLTFRYITQSGSSEYVYLQIIQNGAPTTATITLYSNLPSGRVGFGSAVPTQNTETASFTPGTSVLIRAYPLSLVYVGTNFELKGWIDSNGKQVSYGEIYTIPNVVAGESLTYTALWEPTVGGGGPFE